MTLMRIQCRIHSTTTSKMNLREAHTSGRSNYKRTVRGPYYISHAWFAIGFITFATFFDQGTCSADVFVCPLGKFSCGNQSVCLDQNRWCDGKSDCDAGYDEIHENCQFTGGTYDTIVKIFGNDTIRTINQSCHFSNYPSLCECKEAVISCKEKGFTRLPVDLPSNLTRLIFKGNLLKEIRSHAFQRFSRMTVLHLGGNKIERIDNGGFYGLDRLEKLFLQGNNLTTIETGTIGRLHKLEWLWLSENKLQSIAMDEFKYTNLITINLKWNKLTQVETMVGPANGNLAVLFLDNNKIQRLYSTQFRSMQNLQTLTLSYNDISYIAEDAFKNLPSLTDLDLAWNKLTRLHRKVFEPLTELQLLDLSGNPIILQVNGFSGLQKLEVLKLGAISIDNIQIKMFSSLQSLKFIEFKDFHYCSYAPHVRSCDPKGDGISSFNNLLDNPVLRISIWIVACFTCAGNLAVLISRTLIKTDLNLHSIVIRNLCAADLLMGIYLVIVAAQDVRFRETYNSHAYEWMSSHLCQVTGVLAMISCEVSILILVFMSVERYATISFPYRTFRMSSKLAWIILCSLWVTGLLIGIIPLTSENAFGKFYGSNGVCFPLHIHDPYLKGWEYSAFIFIVLNFTSVAVIVFCYVAMLCSIYKTQRLTESTCAQERSFAKRILVIILSDLMCWVPLITIKLMAFGSIRISDSMYAWLAIFILPINSAINPILYTLTIVSFRRKFLQFWRRKYRSGKTKHCSRFQMGRLAHDTLPRKITPGTSLLTSTHGKLCDSCSNPFTLSSSVSRSMSCSTRSSNDVTL
ncbi:unnamed protein product, partial [Owenia fusiformis]